MPFDSKFIGSVALRRRVALACATVGLVLLAAVPMARMFGDGGWSVLKLLFFVLFLFLFSQVAFSCAVVATGWWVLWTGRQAVRISDTAPLQPIMGRLPATAIVMPIHNEEVGRVFQGLRTIFKSVQQQAGGEAFDFFILSDTTDSNCWIAEEKAWLSLCREVEGFGRIFYRKRRVQIHNKSGNIADFCRRWGSVYRYMIVLDADSLMTGESLVRLVGLMEQNPQAGIIQTTTYPIYGESLFQRIEQFAAFVYRPIFTAGMNFWQLGDATFWGHNAIIRVKPFMEYCAMPELPEIGPLGTRILSHDTIEAALMRRAGYEVWQVYDLKGSYEEGPPHLLASLQRDRRWCHGNLQHLWLLFERGLKPVSRFNILNGILAYANSPIWLASIILGLLLPIHRGSGAHSVNPALLSGALYAYIMILLLASKALGASLFLRAPEQAKLCGGSAKVIEGVVLETIYSMLMGPILMLFYTRFVLASFLGIKVQWAAQTRSDEEGPSWGAWFSLHWQNLLLTIAAWALVIWSRPQLLPWLLPVLIGPIVAIPLCRLTASQKAARAARARGWFLTPEEVKPSLSLDLSAAASARQVPPLFKTREYAGDYGLLQAVLDPYVNAIHVSMLRQRSEASSRTREYMSVVADRLLLEGPFSLSPAEKRTLLWDAEAMLTMHQKLWSSPSSHLHDWWQAAFRNYVESSELTIRRTVAF